MLAPLRVGMHSAPSDRRRDQRTTERCGFRKARSRTSLFAYSATRPVDGTSHEGIKPDDPKAMSYQQAAYLPPRLIEFGFDVADVVAGAGYADPAGLGAVAGFDDVGAPGQGRIAVLDGVGGLAAQRAGFAHVFMIGEMGGS